jgi:hypothetical protein
LSQNRQTRLLRQMTVNENVAAFLRFGERKG